MPRDFNGSTSQLDGGDITALNSLGETSFHIWSWVNYDKTVDPYDDMVIWAKEAGFDGLSAWVDKMQGVVPRVYNMYNSSSEKIEPASENLIVGEWVSLGGYVDWSGTNPSELFVNGVSVGTDTFTTNNMGGNDLLLGRWSSTGRKLPGKLAHFSFWDEEVTAANFVSLAAGGDPATVHASGLLLHWNIAGDTAPEPEEITGTDTLAVTSAAQSVVPTIKQIDAVIAGDNQVDLTAAVGVKKGVLHYYISTSATPPSKADLKSGSGATAFGTLDKPTGALTGLDALGYSFTGGSFIAATNVGATQAVSTDDTWFFTTSPSAVPSSSFYIATYNSSWVFQQNFDTATLGVSGMSQVNGMYVSGSSLFVTGNGGSSPNQGFLLEFSINAPDGVLSAVAQTTLSEEYWAESLTFYDGDWWVCSHQYHGLHRYNTSYVHQANYPFPAWTDPGASRWQGVIVKNDIFYVNVHESNAGGPRWDGYKLVDGVFQAVIIDQSPPTNDVGTVRLTQGFFLESDGVSVLWAARYSASNDGRVYETTGMTLGDADLLFEKNVTGITPGDYYCHCLHEMSPVTYADWNSAIDTSAQFTVTGAAASGKKKHAVKIIRKAFPRRIRHGIRR